MEPDLTKIIMYHFGTDQIAFGNVKQKVWNWITEFEAKEITLEEEIKNVEYLGDIKWEIPLLKDDLVNIGSFNLTSLKIENTKLVLIGIFPLTLKPRIS